MITLCEPYAPRAIRSLELWAPAGWRLKVYGVAYRSERPRADLVVAAKQAAQQRLSDTGEGSNHYGVGFLGVHDGRDADFAFVDWWADENELHHHAFVAPDKDPASLRPTTSSDMVACVWDLAVLTFEREAWVDAVLANPGGPDLEAYLARRLEGEAQGFLP